jgi:hypothetical protein
MSLDSTPEHEFGKSPGEMARAALWLVLLGSAAVVGVVRLLTNPTGLLGRAYASTGLPPWPAYAIGVGIVLALALYGYLRAVRDADRFRVTRDGLEVRGPLGFYRVPWADVAEVSVTAAGALGLKLRSREAMLSSHDGTERQQEWLRTMEPFGDWDLMYPASELGVPAADVLGWINESCPADGSSPPHSHTPTLPHS